jgi:hypothetical protein
MWFRYEVIYANNGAFKTTAAVLSISYIIAESSRTTSQSHADLLTLTFV